MNNQLEQLQGISVSNFAWAKRWLMWFWISQAVAFGINAITAFNSFPPVWGALLGLALATAAEVLRWRSDVLRTKGEFFKRKQELYDGFPGFDFETTIANELAGSREGTYGSCDAVLIQGAQVASSAAKGPQRALESLHESAWYSEHLARRAAYYFVGLLAMAFIVSLLALVVAVGSVRSDLKQGASTTLAATAGGPAASAGEIVGTVVCGALTFLVSISLLRYTLELLGFSKSAAGTVQSAEDVAGHGSADEASVQALMFDYQLARNSSPMIPTWVWKINHSWLNRVYPSASKRVRKGT